MDTINNDTINNKNIKNNMDNINDKNHTNETNNTTNIDESIDINNNDKELNNQTTPEDILIDKYINIIKKDKLEITNKIKNLISSRNNQSLNNTIEILIYKQLGIELEYNGLTTINTLSIDLKELSDSIMIKLDKEIYNKETCYNIYKEEIKKTLLRNQMNWYDNITSNFIEELLKELPQNQNKDIIKEKLYKIISEYKIKLNESYQEILKDYIYQKLIQMKKTIMESKITHFESPMLKKYQEIIKLSNYELINENNTYYAKNKQTKELSELIFDGIKLRSRDNKIIFIADSFSKHHGFIDNEKNISVAIQNNRIDIAINKDNIKDKTIITIIKSEDKYQYYYNHKLITKISNIEEIKNILKKHTKEIYHKLLLNEFHNLLKENNNPLDEINIEELSLSNIEDNSNHLKK